MLSTDLLPWFDALPPFFGGTPCRLFYCLRATEPDRHAVPVLTVLPLLTGEHLEEGDGEKNERTGSLGWVGTPGVSFLSLVMAVRFCSPSLPRHGSPEGLR